MAQSVQNRPGPQGEQEDGDEQIPGLDTTSVGDPFDPRGDLPADEQISVVQKEPVYDDAGVAYVENDVDKDRSRHSADMAKDLHEGMPKTHEERVRLKTAENEAGHPEGFYDDAPEDELVESPSDLSEAESQGDQYGLHDEDTGLYNDENENEDEDQEGSKRGFFRRNKKKMGIAGGFMAFLLGGGIGLFMFLIPLKLEHIVSNLQGTFFSSSQQAVGQEVRNMVKSYLITRVMPGYKSCGSTIKAGCSARKFGSSPVAEMFRTWSDNRLERKLADKGMVLEYKKLSGKWYLDAPSIRGGRVDVGAAGERLGMEIDNHADLAAALDKTIKDETKWYQVYTRYKWGRYVERKFGLPRCIVVCHLVGKDRYYAFHTAVKDKKLMAQLKIVQRVITPHNTTLGIALECLIQDCAATDNQPSGADGENGTPESETDKKIRDALVAYGGSKAANMSEEEIQKLVDSYKEIEEKGLQKYLITKALTPIIGETAAGTTGDVIPIAGWANFLAQIVNAGNDAGGTLKKLRFDVNGAAMAGMALTWMVYADEIHTGSVDATEVGSFSNSLGPGDQGSTNGPPTGGTASAEQTKLYTNLIEKKKGGGTAAAATALLGNPLVGKAYADSATDIASGAAGEICNNGLPVPVNDLICPEDFLGGGNSIANGIHDFFNLPGINVLIPLAQAWKDSVGKIYNFVGAIGGTAFNGIVSALDATCGLPGSQYYNGYCTVKSETGKQIGKIVEGVTKYLISDPFGVPMGGGRSFVVGAGGFDNLGNDSAHRILGAQALTPVQKAHIQQVYDQEEQTQFSQQSVFARMFDGGSQYSLVSKLAMDVPLGGPSVMLQHGFADLMNPLSALGSGFGSIFSGRASAAIDPQADPFGVTQYGYPIGTIPGDPEKYWDQHCVDDASVAYQKGNTWNKAASGTANADPNTGEPLNKTVNPCLLIKASVGSAGGLFDTKNLTKDDLADLNGSDSGSSVSSGGGQVTGIPGKGSGKFTTDTSHPAYPGLDRMLARVKKASTSAGAAAFCASIGGCSGKCESAVEMAWLGHRGQYLDPFGNSNPNGPPGSGSAWAAGLASGHAHPGGRNPPVGALLIYTIPSDQFGHITIYLGNNQVFSTDFDHQGSVGIDPASHIETASWANSYVGWMDPYFSGKVGD